MERVKQVEHELNNPYFDILSQTLLANEIKIHIVPIRIGKG
jgi:hypothetical protein